MFASPSASQSASRAVVSYMSCVVGLGHLLGVLLVGAALAVALLTPRGAATLGSALVDQPGLLASSLAAIAVHLGVSALVWGALGLLVARTRRRRRATVALGRQKRAGSVLTETLVVLPVLLMLVFGLAQLTVNNIAGTLANLAVHQAARSAWVWLPERGRARLDHRITYAEVESRARTAAALVMTPVAPADFIEPDLVGNGPAGDASFWRIHRAMYEASFDRPDAAPQTTIEPVSYSDSFAAALDRSDFDQRSARKLAHAYLALDRMDVRRQGADIVVSLRYQHFQAFPVVRALFGHKLEGSLAPAYLGGSDEYYAPIERTMRMPAQVFSPNTRQP